MPRVLKVYTFIITIFLPLLAIGQSTSDSSTILSNFDLRAQDEQLYLLTDKTSSFASLQIDGEEVNLPINNGKVLISNELTEEGELLFFRGNGEIKLYHASKKIGEKARIKIIPLWLSLLPPLIAIVLALIFKEVLVSLFVGIWAGAFIAGGLRIESIYYFLKSIFSVVEKYVINALNDTGHLSVIVFSILIGGMVAIISKNGGMAGVVKSLSRYANSPASSQFITWLLGVAIFFDDYANTLIVGNTMRSVTDKFKISREKLAYIVDSTAAPVSAVAFITTWIGAELGYIDDGISKIGLDISMTPYALFIESLKYSFYPVLTLTFILILIYTKKDFGSMYKAEVRARTTGQVSSAANEDEDEPDMEDLTPVEGAPLKWWHAALPVLTVIFMTLFGLIDTGFTSLHSAIMDAGISIPSSWGEVWSNINIISTVENPGFFSKLGLLIGSADSYIALLWASLSGVIVAIIITISNKIMNLFDTMHWMVTGFKTMVPALLILTLAWSLAITTDELHTADYLSNLLSGNIHPFAIPVIIFILSAFIAFSTGSSWSTMAILYPIAIPTTYAVCTAAGLDDGHTLDILLNVIATVLAASVLGDHCSPISDTTILSSLASDCNHINHVRTQMPYALTVGGVSISCVFLTAVIGGNWLVNSIILIGGIGILFLIVMKFGKESSIPHNS